MEKLSQWIDGELPEGLVIPGDAQLPTELLIERLDLRRLHQLRLAHLLDRFGGGR